MYLSYERDDITATYRTPSPQQIMLHRYWKASFTVFILEKSLEFTPCLLIWEISGA
jgi:hypothetical protein